MFNSTFSLVGPEIASAATIDVTHFIHKISGSTSITTINPPSDGFTGVVVLIGASGANANLSGGGNIGGSSGIVANAATFLAYDGAFWWPQRT
jgi:hypothetical protein